MIPVNCNSYLHTTPKYPTSIIPSTPTSTSTSTSTSLLLKIRESNKNIIIFNNPTAAAAAAAVRVRVRVRVRSRRNAAGMIVCGFVAVDPWSPNIIDSQSIASLLFAFSLFPYLAFLYFLTKSNNVPKLTLFGFYFLLAFVAATIPAGIYAKVHYGTSLSNVDWLHGGAESLLTLSNLFVVLGLRNALRGPRVTEENQSKEVSELKEGNSSQ